MINQLPYKNSLISYYRWGTGKKILLCFHGYGEDGSSFAFLEKSLGEHYTLLAPDIPLHGLTEWNEGPHFAPTQLVEIIRLITSKPEFAGNSQRQKISLAGYSLGGRICLQLAELMPQQIEKMVLIAPDGFHKNFWYHFSTQTIPGNKLFRYTMEHPAWLFTAMKMAGATGLINKSILKLAYNYLGDAPERELLYRRWTTMRQFRPDMEKLTKAFGHHRIPVKLLFGRHDNVILAKRAINLKESLPEYVQIHLTNAGHQLLKEKHAGTIAALFFE